MAKFKGIWSVVMVIGVITVFAGLVQASNSPRIALLLFSRGFEFMVALDEGATEKAKELGMEIVVLDGQSSTEVQMKQVDDLITAGVDAILISPYHSEQIVPAVRRAKEAGVPVISVDAIVAERGLVRSHVGFDNAAGGRVAAQYIASKLGGKGTVLELMGAIGAYHAQERHRGFIEEISKYPEIKVISKPCEWVADNAQKAVIDVFTADPRVDAIFSHNDEMLVGVVPALKQLGRLVPVGEPGHVIVVGIDATPSGLARIREGWQDASVQQDPYEMGSVAVEYAARILRGEEVPEVYYVQPLLVTRENVDDPKLWANVFVARRGK